MFGAVAFLVALCAAFFTRICHAHEAHSLPPPTDLRYDWPDPLTLKLSWSWSKHRPKDLPKDCAIRFEVTRSGRDPIHTLETSYLDDPLTDSAARWHCSVRTIAVSTVSTGSSSCKKWKSREVKLDVEPPKPRAEENGFKCYLSESDMNCSWTSDSELSLSHRDCGARQDLINQFKPCDQTSSVGPRRVCRLKGNFIQKDVCMVLSSPDALKTFRAPKTLKLLTGMKILEEEYNLVVNLPPLQMQISGLMYNVCYSVCDTITCKEQEITNKSIKIPYDKSCQYKFQYQVHPNSYSTPIFSDWSEEIVYGSTDMTLTVVTIVIPIILSICVILSCVCFRRHKDIICPEVPDPSAIFKEIINGNKEMKPKVHMYTPVQEPIEPITIVPHIPSVSGLVST